MSREKVFISYSHRDRGWLERLLEHLAVLERWDLVHPWSDTRIGAGADWQEEIDGALGQSKVAVLLISPAFLASRYIWEREWPRIREHRVQGMEILPLVVRACAWRLDRELRELQVRPVEGRPLAVGNEAQIDLDLPGFVYELAAMVQQFPGDRALRERELAERYRVAAGQAVRGNGGYWQGSTSLDEGVRPGRASREMPRSWTGVYNDDFTLNLTIADPVGQRFEGRIRYLGTETVTRVAGSFEEDASKVASDLGLHLDRGQDPRDVPLAAVFQETGYEKQGKRRVSFDGQYRAIVSDQSIVGGWFARGRLVARFELRPDDSSR